MRVNMFAQLHYEDHWYLTHILLHYNSYPQTTLCSGTVDAPAI